MREALGGALAIVPSAKKVGGIGCRMDIPITHINALMYAVILTQWKFTYRTRQEQMKLFMD